VSNVISNFDREVSLQHQAPAFIYNGRWSRQNAMHQWMFTWVM